MKPPLHFTKMQAAGNDFILLDNRERRFEPEEFAELARRLCHRKFGIGADGLMLLEEPESPSGESVATESEASDTTAAGERVATGPGGSANTATGEYPTASGAPPLSSGESTTRPYGESRATELIMHYKNPDGSDAGMCGNGARCFVRFAHSLGYYGEIHFQVHGRHYLGSRSGETLTIHFPLETVVTPVDVDAGTVEAGTVETDTALSVYTHTEHVVIPVEPVQLKKLPLLVARGRSLRHHEQFAPRGTNVNFMSGISDHELKLQTYERGVEDLTLACGTGAVAAALAWHHLNRTHADGGSHVTTVQTAGGELYVHFNFQPETEIYHTIALEGPAQTVFEGSCNLENLPDTF